MHLVAVFDPAQDRDGVLDARLADEDHLEAPFERLILLEVLAELVERRRADRAQLAARERRLEDVGGVHRALGRARADERVDLVDEEDHLALAVGDLLDDGFEPVLELAAVLRAGDQRAHVEREDPLRLQPFGHVALHDADGEALGDGRLADAGLADEHGVVLRPPRKDLEHAADLLVAPDHGVDFAFAGELVEVAGVAVERFVLRLGVGVGDALAAAHLLHRVEYALLRDVLLFQRPADGVVALRHREQQVFGGDVLVAEPLGLFERAVEDLIQIIADVLAADARAGHFWQLVERLVGLRRDEVEVRVEAGEERPHDGALVGEEGLHDVRRLDALMAQPGGDFERGLDGFLGFDGKFLEVHFSSVLIVDAEGEGLGQLPFARPGVGGHNPRPLMIEYRTTRRCVSG